MQCVAQIRTAWRDPVAVLSAWAEEPWALGLISGGEGERGPVVLSGARSRHDPDLRAGRSRAIRFAGVARMLGAEAPLAAGGPPFQGGGGGAGGL